MLGNNMYIYARHYTDIDLNKWNYRYFTPKELASKGDGSIKISVPALDKLEALREAVGCPIIINSAYRDPIHNAKVGGAPLSRHKFGDAFDISLATVEKDKLIKVAQDIGFGGIGINYKSFVHLDNRGYKARW